MRRLRLTAASVLFLGGAAMVAHGQSLGEAAAKERERRAKTGDTRPSVPTYTDADLEEQRKAAGVGGAAAPATDSSAAAPAEVGETRRRSETPDTQDEAERALVAAVESLKGRVKAAEEQLATLQALLNPMSSTFIYGPNGSGSAQEELQIRARIQSEQEALSSLQTQLEGATQELEGYRGRRRSSGGGERGE